MSLLRLVARPMLASMFVTGGFDALLQPGSKVAMAQDVSSGVAEPIPGLPEQDPEMLIRINGGVQVGAGVLFALGLAPRLSAAALAATLVPTTAAAHRFWDVEDPAERQQQQMHFFKNVSMLGGLLIAAVDTEGRPGVAWRTRHAASRAETTAKRGRREARLAARAAVADAARALRKSQAGLTAPAARAKLRA